MAWFTSNKGPLIDVSSGTSVNNINDHLFIGSLASARVVKFKAFVKDYKINLSSNIEEKKDALIHSRVYVATTGDWSWNISFDIPASNIEESKRNLSKISELQKMTTMNSSGKDWKGIVRTETSWVVHYKNLICNNNINEYNEVEPNSWTALLKKGAHVWCDEVKYSPDLDMGFFIDTNGTYPKNLTVNLTLNLRNSEKDINRWVGEYGISSYNYYINSFNTKGQYTPDANYLTPFGVSLMEMPTKAQIRTAKELNSDCNGEQNFFFISLPYSTRPSDIANVEKMGGNSENGPGPKFLVFKGFLEKFEGSQKVENKPITAHAHTENPIKKHNESTKNDDYDYSLTLNVPSSSLEEARRNLGKLQWLIRMYFTRNTVVSLFPGNDISYNLDIQKVRVFLPGLIQKPGISPVNANYSHALAGFYHSNTLALEFTKLDITFNNEMGFFRSNDEPEDAAERGPYIEKNSIYPKSFSISMNFSLDVSGIYNYERTSGGKWGIFTPNEPAENDKQKWGIWNGKNGHKFPIGSIFNQPTDSASAARGASAAGGAPAAGGASAGEDSASAAVDTGSNYIVLDVAPEQTEVQSIDVSAPDRNELYPMPSEKEMIAAILEGAK